MIDRELDIQTADGAMNTFVTHPEEGGPHPVVLFYMDAPGKRGELPQERSRLTARLRQASMHLAVPLLATLGTGPLIAHYFGHVSLAGFAVAESVDVSMAGFGGGCPQRPGDRTAIPAAVRYRLAVSRRTPVVSSMRRSDHPSRPSASTCSRFSVPKTFAMRAGDHVSHCASTSGRQSLWPLFRRPSMAGFGCSPRAFALSPRQGGADGLAGP